MDDVRQASELAEKKRRILEMVETLKSMPYEERYPAIMEQFGEDMREQHQKSMKIVATLLAMVQERSALTSDPMELFTYIAAVIDQTSQHKAAVGFALAALLVEIQTAVKKKAEGEGN